MNMDKLYCIGYIDDELIEKADKYISKKKKCTFKKLTALAASFITIFLIFAALISFKNKNTITAYAYVTNEKITSTAAVIKTGTISDSGEMKGHQLIFYILGENIEKIRKGDISYEQSRCSTCSHGRSHESKRQSKKRFLIHAVIRTEKCGDRQAFSAD